MRINLLLLIAMNKRTKKRAFGLAVCANGLLWSRENEGDGEVSNGRDRGGFFIPQTPGKRMPQGLMPPWFFSVRPEDKGTITVSRFMWLRGGFC